MRVVGTRSIYYCLGLVLVTTVMASAAPKAWAVQARQNLAPSEQKLANEFVEKVNDLLPGTIQETLGQNVVIRFAKLDQYSEIIPPACPGEATPNRQTPSILGKVPKFFLFGRKREIVLNRNFLKELAKGPEHARTYNCGHGNINRLALATVIHELSHLFQKAKGSEFKRDYREFLAWKRGILDTKSKNRLYVRSPDPYEYKNISEHFAVNAEYFLMDPEYRCRRPEQYRYFEKHFGYSPYSVGQVCKLGTDVRLSTNLLPISLDPSRVYQIHYLLADRGTAMESKWGHAMFRIIQCAPNRSKVGPECVQDIGSHVVVSFRASISGLNANKLGGLTGKFPSQLFLYSMPEIIGEYTMSESRPVKSVPLKLSEAEVDQFVRRTLELYWEYQGRFYFLSNNCASESLQFLAGVLAGGENSAPDAFIATPTGIYKKLKKAGLIDETVFSDPQANGRYYFPSFRSRAEEAFRNISKRKGFDSNLSMEQFLQYGAKDRRTFYETLKAADPRGIDRVAIQFYILELLIREKQNALTKKLASKIVDGSIEEIANENSGKTLDLAQMISEVSKLRSELQPWFFLSKGYGVPQSADFKDFSLIKEKVNAIRDLANQILVVINDSGGDVFEELENISENTMYFMNEIRNTKNGS